MREHDITVLPAVSSLKALRRVGKASTAARPMLGIGNPLLDGPDERYGNRAKQARAKQSCSPPQQIAVGDGHRADPKRVALRGGLADVTDIKNRYRCPRPPTSCAPSPMT